VQPDHLTWDDFTARQAAREAGEDVASIQPSRQRQPEAKQASLSAVLMEAIHLAGARRGRIPRAERIREETLLAVLTETLRRR
jgi:hypothetical protein